jgi:hypothetical protein
MGGNEKTCNIFVGKPPPILILGTTLGEWQVSRSDPFIRCERALSIHWIGSWAVPEPVWKRCKQFYYFQIWNGKNPKVLKATRKPQKDTRKELCCKVPQWMWLTERVNKQDMELRRTISLVNRKSRVAVGSRVVTVNICRDRLNYVTVRCCCCTVRCLLMHHLLNGMRPRAQSFRLRFARKACLILSGETYFFQYTEWSKSRASHSWHMFYMSKNKLHWNQKTKNYVILSFRNVHRVYRCMHSLFYSCLMQPGEEFLCHGNGSPDEILLICLAQGNREMYP